MGENIYIVEEANVKYVMKTILNEIGDGDIESACVDKVEEKFFDKFEKNDEGKYEFTVEQITRFVYDMLIEEYDGDITEDLLKSEDIKLVVSPDGGMSFEFRE